LIGGFNISAFELTNKGFCFLALSFAKEISLITQRKV
jgi:hypothetical protein